MRRSPLAALILSGSFAFQLALAGGGAACLDPDHRSSLAAAGAEALAMPGMDAGMDMAADHAGHGTQSGSGQMPAHGEAPCEEPAAPGTCQAMAPCAGGFFASDFAAIDTTDLARSHVAARPALALSSRTVQPELPPPRA